MISKHVERHRAGVYKITNLLTGKFYLGGSKEIYNRKHTHISKIKSKVHSCKDLQQDYHEFGGDNFLFEVIEYCDNYEEREQYYSDLLKPTYNKRTKVDLNIGISPSKEARKSISDTLKKRYEEGMTSYRQQHRWRVVEKYDSKGNLLETFPNAREAELKCGYTLGNVSRWCNREPNLRIGDGFQWRYADSNKQILVS